MNSGGDASVRQIANNSSSFTGDSFSSPVADSSAYFSYPSQADSFAVGEGPTPYDVSGGSSLAGFFVSPKTPVNVPYEVARTLMNFAGQSSHNEEYMILLGRLVYGQHQQLLGVLRATFEIGASYPPGSDERWSAVSTLFSAFVLADQHGDQEVTSWIDEYIRDLGYAVYITFEQGPDHSGPKTLTYNISGPVLPLREAEPPPQEQPPQPPDATPPVRRQRPMRREQVAAEEQPPRPPDQTSEAQAMPPVELQTATEQSLPASGDPLELGYATFGDIFAGTLDSERNSFLARRAEQRKNGARLPSAPDPDAPIAPLICVCDDDRSM
jgi:hypothetical protein